MAKFGITAEGVSALRQLAKDMKTINNELEDSARTLKTKISGLGDGLGNYEEPILNLIECVNLAQVGGREAIEVLIVKVNQLAETVDALLVEGIN